MIDPTVFDACKMQLFMNMTRLLVDNIPPSAGLRIPKDELQQFVQRYSSPGVEMMVVGAIISHLGGECNDEAQHILKENKKTVLGAVEKIRSYEEFRDYISSYVDLAAKDGRPECRVRAQEWGLYVASSDGKSSIDAELNSVCGMSTEIAGAKGGSGCLIVLAILGVSIICGVCAVGLCW